MTFAFDIDGTITKYPGVFEALGRALKSDGHRVIVLTGNRRVTVDGDRKESYPVLTRDGWYDEIVTFDDATDDERKMIRTHGARAAVGAFKRRVCNQMNVEVLFDDDVEFVRESGQVPVWGVA